MRVLQIHTLRFNSSTDLLSAGQWYAQPFTMDLSGIEKNISDHYKWPDNNGT